MLGKTKHQTPVRLVKVSVFPAPSFFFQEPAGQGESGQCGPSDYASPGPNWISPSSPIGPVSIQSTALLIGTGPQTKQGVGLYLPLERFLTRHLTCHYLLMDQAYCDLML